jgi:predicted Zn finger-like uncharacterized protein
MQIVCPHCTTSYQLGSDAIGANGRSVRCVRCQTVWFAAPPVETVAAPAIVPEPEPAPEQAVAAHAEPAAEPPDSFAPPPDDPASPEALRPAGDDPVALAEIPIPAEVAPPLAPDAGSGLPSAPAELDNGPPDVESVAARRSRAAARKRRSKWRIPVPVVIVVLISACVALLGWRKDVVRYAPQMASFYSAIGLPVNLRGLAFTNVKIGNEIHDGVPVLVVEGTIVSLVSKPVEVPRLRFALRNASGAEVYAWTAVPSQPVLEPFETLPFRSRLASPPAEGHDIQVRFFTRRDAVAGLN